MKTWRMMLLLVALGALSAARASDRTGPPSLDDPCIGDETVYLSQYVFEDEEVVADEGDDCGRTTDPDYIWRLIVTGSGLWTIEDEYCTARFYLLTECCSGDQIFPRGRVDSYCHIPCVYLEQGEYFLVAESDDDVLLMITPCEDPCVTQQLDDGVFYEGDQGMYVQTTDASSPESLYDGPWQMQGTPCQDETANPDGAVVGFNYYNWFNQDFDWNHFFTSENFECQDFVVDSACVLICAYEVDACGPSRPNLNCEEDYVHFDGGGAAIPHLNPYADPGSNLSNSVTRIPVPLGALEDGALNVFLDIDAYSEECAWATTVKWSQLVVYFTCSQTPPEPLGFDLGDLPPLDDLGNACYPTASVENGGPGNAVFAPEDQVAWIGECVDFELSPRLPDADDPCDDGIDFIPSNYSGGSWMPCELACVDITVTTGPAYEAGTPMFLWGWKDGNLDCDFDDIYTECMGQDDTYVVDECLIDGSEISLSGPNMSQTFRRCFIDPGVLDLGRYDGYLRFRLVSDRELNCVTALTSVDEVLGETQDYIVGDLQLAVELQSFTASGTNGRVVLSWTTATESENEGFAVQRWNGSAWLHLGNDIQGAGNSATARQYQFLDGDVTVGETYRYRLISIDFSGNRMVTGEVETSVSPVNEVVTAYALHQNYPNPFNPATTIRYDLASSTRVSLKVFDLLGREVADLVHSNQNAGTYEIAFDAVSLPSGMYFYKLETDGFTDMKKMMLLK